jgi:CHAD domain-containing protein
MTFRLKRKTSIGPQLAHIVARESRKAAEEVAAASPAEESVHEARKHVKKIRAVLHMLRSELGGDYDSLNNWNRSAAHRISAVRDADALIGTMKSLRKRYPAVICTGFRTATATLEARRREAYARLAGRHLSDITHMLERSRRSLRSSVRHAANGRSLRDGIARGYRRARHEMAQAAASTDDARFHLWRRRVKDHWYQMRLVEGFSTRAHARILALGRLQEWLGEHHNLSVLRGVILEQPQRFGDARSVDVVLGCIDKRQASLRQQAIRRGRSLFSAKPSSFRAQITQWWTKASPPES